MPNFLVNGQPAMTLPLTDRGLHYGDGLFETIAIQGHKPIFWQEHMDRLIRDCQRLNLPMPQKDTLYREGNYFFTQEAKGVLKIIITRGSGGRGYRVSQESIATRIVGFYPWPKYPKSYAEEGIHVFPCLTQLGHQPRLAGIKHLNRLEQILARQEWQTPDYAEGIMCDQQNNVIEGTMSNVFMVEGKKLLTPLLDCCGVAGVMRRIILRMAKALNITVNEVPISQERLLNANEIFVCNSIIGIWPVLKVGNKAFRRGSITTRLQQQLQLQLNHEYQI